jgi:predicted alpha/beta-hydrolase family hydrolase
MLTQKVSIPVRKSSVVSGVLCASERHQPGKGTAVVLAHGARNDMEHPLIVTLSEGLAQAGCLTLRFNFLYREEGRSAPDSQDTLVLTWQSVFRFLAGNETYKTERMVAAGKSMGGRVASQMVAEGLLPATHLVLLGYPLHPPRKQEKLRDAHLYRIKMPMLFFAGTRDPLCNLKALEWVVDRLNAPAELEVIEGGDHSFGLRKVSDEIQHAVYGRILDRTSAWLGRP